MKRWSVGVVVAVLIVFPAAAHAAFGDPDPTYGTNGLAPLRTEAITPAPSFALGMRLRTDSTVDLVATSGNGSRFELAIMRYGIGLNRISRVRAGFGVSSLAPSASLARSNGGFLTVGYVMTPLGTRLVVVATTASGALDRTFGTQGVATVATVRHPSGDAKIALGPGGTIVVAHSVLAAAGASIPVVRLHRLTARGARDNTFGTSGVVTITMATSTAYPAGLVVATNGKITLALLGYRASGAGVIMRRTARGGIDTTFDGDGIAQEAPGLSPDDFYPADLAIQSDNRVTVLATDYTSGAITPMAYRLTTAGGVDSTFGMAGGRTNFLPAGATSGNATRILRRANGKYAVVLRSTAGVVGPALGRTDANGKNATTVALVNAGDTFAPAVLAANGSTVALAGIRNTQSQIAIMRVDDSDATGNASSWGADQPGGTARGSLDYSGFIVPDRSGGALASSTYGTDLRIVALDAAGKPNTSFGGGFRRFAGMVGNGSVQAIRRLPDGRVAVAINDFGTPPKLVMLRADGQLDTTFAGSGTLSLGANTSIGDVIALPGGKLLLGMGYRIPPSRWGMRMVRLTSTGAYDTTFSTDGIVDLAPTAAGSGGQGTTHVHTDAFGYVGAGGASEYALIARVSTAGDPDTTIGGGTGLVEIPVTGLSVEEIGVDRKNRAIFVGSRGNNAVVLRLNRSLAVDPTFSGDGIMQFAGPGQERAVGVAGLPDGSLVVRSLTIPLSGGFANVNDVALAENGTVRARRFDPTDSFDLNPRVTADGRRLSALFMFNNAGYDAYVRRVKGLPPVKPTAARRLTGKRFRVRVDSRGLTRTVVQIQALRNGRWKVIGTKRVPALVGPRNLVLSTSRRVTDRRFRAVLVNMSGVNRGAAFNG